MVDWTKPVEDINGVEAEVTRISDNGTAYPVSVRVRRAACDGSKVTYLHNVTLDGRLRTTDERPYIRNVPEEFERTVWVNVYEERAGRRAHSSRKRADLAADEDRIACIKTTITGTVGQFDE